MNSTNTNRTAYDPQALRTCQRCNVPYAWSRSPASLKMTYCGSLCETADLGFSLEAILRYEPPTLMERIEAVAADAWDRVAESIEAGRAAAAA